MIELQLTTEESEEIRCAMLARLDLLASIAQTCSQMPLDLEVRRMALDADVRGELTVAAYNKIVKGLMGDFAAGHPEIDAVDRGES